MKAIESCENDDCVLSGICHYPHSNNCRPNKTNPFELIWYRADCSQAKTERNNAKIKHKPFKNMTPKEKALQIRSLFVDVTKNYHPERGWLPDLDSARQAAITALKVMRESRRNDERYDYSFWDDVQLELETL